MDKAIEIYSGRITDAFQIEMIHRNSIPGLLPFEVSDGFIHYQTDSLVSLEEYLSTHTMTTTGFKLLLENFIGIVEDSILYYLDKNNYVISSDFIYVDHRLMEMKIAYLPLLETEETEAQIKDPVRVFIFEVLLPRMKMNFEEDWTFLLEGLSHLNGGGMNTLAFEQVKAFFLKDNQKEVIRQVPEEYAGNEDKHSNIMEAKAKLSVKRKTQTTLKDKLIQLTNRKASTLSIEETSAVLSNKTTVLRAADKMVELVARDNKWTNISLDSKTMIVGRHKKTADIILAEPSIGKLHAELICDKGDYYLRDLNSVNGTFVNDTRLLPYQMMLLKNGDIVQFSTIAYEVDYGV